MEIVMAIVHPTGHANHMPMEFFVRSDKKNAKNTRRIKSVKVAAINWRIALTPRRIPSAASFAEIIK